ncbi:MAG: hypothetical protein HY735_19635 [Verrucomicrobia bacterium]|nr:hypothetical protein [Verrucomicrobiota bacterium]
MNQPNADELVHQILDLRIATNNLFVKASAVNSRDAPEHHEHRFPGFRGFGDAAREVIVNPIAPGLDFGAIHQNSFSPIFRCAGSDRGHEEETNEARELAKHGVFS